MENTRENKFKNMIKNEFGLLDIIMSDSVFLPKYHLNETDVLYIIYILISEKPCSKNKLENLLEEEITFEKLLELS